uniref:Uncharacterized protein n=1 Tax=Colobus angolensis palliatus TaxID=336983 RepID=A0A2K5HBP3_COLAP
IVKTCRAVRRHELAFPLVQFPFLRQRMMILVTVFALKQHLSCGWYLVLCFLMTVSQQSCEADLHIPSIFVCSHAADKDVPEMVIYKEKGLMDSFHVAGETSQSWWKVKGTSYMAVDKRE